MNKLLIILLIIMAIFYFKNQKTSESFNTYSEPALTYSKPIPQVNNSKFRCDGRTHCSHMTSCDEAKFFIKNCPNTEMDGDGVPCERQLCGFK